MQAAANHNLFLRTAHAPGVMQIRSQFLPQKQNSLFVAILREAGWVWATQHCGSMFFLRSTCKAAIRKIFILKIIRYLFRTRLEEIIMTARIRRSRRLGTIREDGYPYVIAMHFVYYKGNIYMHGLPKGQKIDNINSNPKACFEVDELLGFQPGDKIACDTDGVHNSVVLTGPAQILHDIECKRDVLNRLAKKYPPQFAGQELPENMVKGTAVIELQVLERTGKYHK